MGVAGKDRWGQFNESSSGSGNPPATSSIRFGNERINRTRPVDAMEESECIPLFADERGPDDLLTATALTWRPDPRATHIGAAQIPLIQSSVARRHSTAQMHRHLRHLRHLPHCRCYCHHHPRCCCRHRRWGAPVAGLSTSPPKLWAPLPAPRRHQATPRHNRRHCCLLRSTYWRDADALLPSAPK